MFCDLNQYLAQIGLYYSSHTHGISKKVKEIQNKCFSSSNSFFYFFVYINILFYIVYAGVTVFKIIKNYLILKLSNVCYLYIFIACLLMLCGDIEVNPGPRKDQNLSFCLWNCKITTTLIFLLCMLLFLFFNFTLFQKANL